MSNSAYADQRKYGGSIANISNSPYTDERRQGGGGGVPGDGTGNVQYDIANQTLNTRLAEVNTIIQDINQGGSDFSIGNDAGKIEFDAGAGNVVLSHSSNETGNIILECEATTGGNGNIILVTDTVGTTGAGNLNANISGNILLNAQQAVSITSSLADVNIQADEIARVQGLKGASLQGGLDSSGNFENQINMTLDNLNAITEIKSEGDTETNGINIITRTNANQGCVIALNSTDVSSLPDRIVNSVIGIPPFQAGINNQAWFTVQGTSLTDSIARRMLFFEKKAEFTNFTTIAFSGGTVDPVFEFKANQYYQFINDPTATGDVLTVTSGSGSETDPWSMEWLPNGSGGGNVTSTIVNILQKTVNGVTTEIPSISQQGDFKIESDNDIEINSAGGDVTLRLGSQTTASTGVYNNDSFKDTAGDLFAWRNRQLNTGALIGGFKMARDGNGEELIICDNIDAFSFAGNSDAITTAIKPIIRFNQLPSIGCSLRFDNAPQNAGDILTVTGGNGSNVSPYTLNWQPPAGGGGGGNVTSDFLTDRLTRDNGAGTQVPIQNIIQRGSGANNNLNNPFLLSSGGPISIISDSLTSAQLPGILIDATTNNDTITENVTAIFRAEKTTPQGGVVRKAEIECVVDNSVDQRTDYIQLQVTRNLQPAPDDIATIILEQTSQIVPPDVLNLNRFRCDNVTDFMFASINVNEPAFTFRSSQYWEFVNDAVDGDVLTCNGGTGARNDPKELTWSSGNNLNTLDINYDQTTSILVLSDPTDGVISTTTVVPGRTVLVEDVTVNGTTELSALGLSNSIFPPPLEGQAGYFDGLIGNSPPRVSLNPVTGLTNWFKGASFRATLSGEIVKIGGYDDIILRVYSNRGQTSQNILNSFRMVTRSVSPPPKLGWKWVIDFTCRSVNDGGVLGVLTSSSQFDYTDDTYTLETYGAIVSNTNSSFDSSIDQYIDLTIEFDYYNNSNNIKTTLCTIERIY